MKFQKGAYNPKGAHEWAVTVRVWNPNSYTAEEIRNAPREYFSSREDMRKWARRNGYALHAVGNVERFMHDMDIIGISHIYEAVAR